jgi:hypothetical protein
LEVPIITLTAKKTKYKSIDYGRVGQMMENLYCDDPPIFLFFALAIRS